MNNHIAPLMRILPLLGLFRFSSMSSDSVAKDAAPVAADAAAAPAAAAPVKDAAPASVVEENKKEEEKNADVIVLSGGGIKKKILKVGCFTASFGSFVSNTAPYTLITNALAHCLVLTTARHGRDPFVGHEGRVPLRRYPSRRHQV
jgi:hypothetical protein